MPEVKCAKVEYKKWKGREEGNVAVSVVKGTSIEVEGVN